MRIYLGIDGGGTKTASVIIDENGTEYGHGLGGPGNIAQYSDSELFRSLSVSIQNACASAGLEYNTIRFDGVCAAMAGYSAKSRRDEFETLLSNSISATTHQIAPDYVAAFWGATHGEPGIIVIAGTGAVAYGQNAMNETWREDGLGYLLGDRGSGFDLGLHALRHTLQCLSNNRFDELARSVLDYTKTKDQNEIVQWIYGDFNPARVAGLAPIIGALAEAGDQNARKQIAAMAHELRRTVQSVRHKLKLGTDSPIYPLGGLWRLGEFFRSEFENPANQTDKADSVETDQETENRLRIATPLSDAALGAALMALKQVRT